MSDGSLSQDEIDALLQGGGTDFDASSVGDSGGAEGQLSGDEIGAFKGLLDSIVDAQSSNLSGLLGGKSVTIQPPVVNVPTNDEVIQEFSQEIVKVDLDYVEGLTGSHFYILDNDSATTLAGLIVGQEQIDLNEMALESLKEALSTITGVALTTIGDTIGSTIMPSAGESQQTPGSSMQLPDSGVVKAAYSVQIEGENPVQMNEFFELPVVRTILSTIAPSDAQQQQDSSGMDMDFGTQDMGGGMQQPQQQPQQNMGQQFGQGFGQQQGNFGGQQPQMGGQFGGGQFGGQVYGSQQPPNVQSVQFPSLSSGQGSSESGNISLLMDVYMEMTVELGRTKKSIKEILGMGEGTIIELDKLAGEPVDILVNHKLIATGEVVVIDENFGVRVTEIVSPTERMKDLT